MKNIIFLMLSSFVCLHTMNENNTEPKVFNHEIRPESQHAAATIGDAMILKIMFSRDDKFIDRRAVDTYRSPLHVTSARGHEEATKVLLEFNANVNAKDKFGDTPLHLAAREGKDTIVALLLMHKASVDATNNDLKTPLHFCR